MTAAVAAMPGQRRDTMPTRAGSEIATVTMSEMRQSSGPSARALSTMAATGTTGAKAGTRSMRPANSALAAIGRKPGACGTSRATTSNPIRNATRARSIHRSARVLLACIAVRSLCGSNLSLHSTGDAEILSPEMAL